MGFLTGSFLKIYTARQRLQLQHQLTSVSMKLNRVTRQMGDFQKQLTKMKQMQTMNMSAIQSQMMKGAYAQMQSQQASIFDQAGLTESQKTSQLTNLNSSFAYAQQDIATQMSQMKAQQDMAMEEFEEAQLEPLKNLEESLKVEQETLQSRIKLLEGQEQAAGEMQKQGSKDFVPEYTGGG